MRICNVYLQDYTTMLVYHFEEQSNQFLRFTVKLRRETGRGNVEESRPALRRDGLRQQRLPGPRSTIITPWVLDLSNDSETTFGADFLKRTAYVVDNYIILRY